MKIGAQNFQGVTSYQEIEIKQLCLLYGKNSSGKSSILDAISVGKNIHKKGGSALPNKWISSIPEIPKEAEKETILYFEEKISISFDDWYNNTLKTCFYPQEDFPPVKLIEDALHQDLKIAIEIRWKSSENEQWLAGYKVFLDDTPAFAWSGNANSTGKGTIYKNNDFIRKIIKNAEEDPWTESSITDVTENTAEEFCCAFDIYSFDGSVNFVLDNMNGILADQDDLPLFLFMFLISGTSYWLSRVLEFNEVPAIRPTDNIPFSKKSLWSADYDRSRDHEALLNIFNLESKNNEDHTYLKELALINEFLSSDRYMDSGFRVEPEIRYQMTQTSLDEYLGTPENQRTEFLNTLEPEQTITKLALKDLARGTLVELNDVGVGLSQVIPVIVAAATGRKAFIQQPELHLHPKMQASIADVFIAASNREHFPYDPPTFILETHSELLALRVLRRISETSRAHIKDKSLKLHPDQVSIIYVDRNKNGETTLTNLRVSEAGEFLDRWPDGFFAERDAELFYD